MNQSCRAGGKDKIIGRTQVNIDSMSLGNWRVNRKTFLTDNCKSFTFFVETWHYDIGNSINWDNNSLWSTLSNDIKLDATSLDSYDKHLLISVMLLAQVQWHTKNRGLKFLTWQKKLEEIAPVRDAWEEKQNLGLVINFKGHSNNAFHTASPHILEPVNSMAISREMWCTSTIKSEVEAVLVYLHHIFEDLTTINCTCLCLLRRNPYFGRQSFVKISQGRCALQR